jgi:hypothetical protein
MTRRPLPLLCLFLAGVLLGFQVGRSYLGRSVQQPPGPFEQRVRELWEPTNPVDCKATALYLLYADGQLVELPPGCVCLWDGRVPGRVTWVGKAP